MKQMFRFNLLLYVQLFIAFCTFSQANDPQATKILNEISQKYKSYTTLQTYFTLKVEERDGKIISNQQGILHTKGDKYKLELPGQELYCDNETCWLYLKDANEVQINNYDPLEQSIIPTQFYTIYEKDYFYALTEEITENNKVYQIIELTPNDKSKSYFKIKLSINKANKSITNIKVFDKGGSRYVYEIQKQTPNLILNDTFFKFDATKHPGIEVIDLK
ncbi:MAG: outer membrane lipoprotein carrier protein LolA [Bacteroidetes bacterium]|nr:outer membrane lipoprotein carrier protein LolA [Bacteroidota bacterium]